MIKYLERENCILRAIIGHEICIRFVKFVLLLREHSAVFVNALLHFCFLFSCALAVEFHAALLQTVTAILVQQVSENHSVSMNIWHEVYSKITLYHRAVEHRILHDDVLTNKCSNNFTCFGQNAIPN